MSSVDIRSVAWPDFTTSLERPQIPAAKYERRCSEAYEKAGCDWVVVYGDREHWGNMGFVTGFDPRFEEALLLLGPGGSRFLVVGNEGLIYQESARMRLELLLCQTLSLMGQPRSKAPRLVDVLRQAGITTNQSVAVVGWKYVEPGESDEPTRPAFVPAFVVDSVTRATGVAPVDATAVFMNPVNGLRTIVDAEQIAAWEYAAVHAARAVFSVIEGTRPGHSEYSAMGAMNYQGAPLSTHVMFASGKEELNGLRSPSAKIVEQGDAVTTAIGFWGGLTCRAGIVGDKDDGFLKETVFPYFRAIASWYSNLSIGTTGDYIWNVVMEEFAHVKFGPLVNPGHLIGHEEWTNTPFRQGCAATLKSGMTIQSDIIPFPLPPGHAVNAEDTIVLADSGLRSDLVTRFPELWKRIQQRRTYMNDEIGIVLGEDVLPLSPTCGYLPPLWQAPSHSCVIN